MCNDDSNKKVFKKKYERDEQEQGVCITQYLLGVHFVWTFSLMFLFRERGYWQELLESIVWAHNKLKVAPATQPKTLSIIKGRALEVTHYLLGGIVTTSTFFLARIIAVELIYFSSYFVIKLNEIFIKLNYFHN